MATPPQRAITWRPPLVAIAAMTCVFLPTLGLAAGVRAEVRTGEGTITIPTYTWEDDVNPKFWALEGGAKLSTTIKGAIIYPYSMQDHLSRTKVDRTYKALFLENEYLKVTCLPELGGRLHSVLDKTEGKEMFHLNRVIKPGMIAMRGAWISGGVEWNAGPHGHTVTVLSPVDALAGRNPDGSAYLEISNQEKIFRTRWTVRLTLHPGRAYLDERIRLENPTDGMHPYYFWNCTAFPNRPGTRFIYPMSLGTDHNALEFFHWPVHEGRDLSWLKNYEVYSSIFAVDCRYDFFGAYDVDADRGIVQVADHHELGGKKAWTWGQWDFGRVAQNNLTDDDGPYIEVQSGPLPTQSDYGMLAPGDRVAWQEYWYPVHGLGDGFEYAAKNLAVQTSRDGGRLTLRLLATGRFPRSLCVLSRDGTEVVREQIDLSPEKPQVVTLTEKPQEPVDVEVLAGDGRVLASFTTPLPIPKTDPPKRPAYLDAPDEDLSAEQLYLKGRKFDRATERPKGREYYEKALAQDPGHVLSLRSLGGLDFEAGLYRRAIERLQEAVLRDGDEGLAWFYLGACHFRLGDWQEAIRCAYRATRCPGTASIGCDLAGRAHMRVGDAGAGVEAFKKAVRANNNDSTAVDHLMLALHAAGNTQAAARLAKRRIAENPTGLVPRALLALETEAATKDFAREAHEFVGEDDFELIETSLVFAEMGLVDEAARILQAGCVDLVPADERGALPLYYLAWYASLRGDEKAAGDWLDRAAKTHKPLEFASRPQTLEVLQYALQKNPADARAHLQLGNLLANLGRVDEAVAQWKQAAETNPGLSIAWRNLALAAATRDDAAEAERCFRKAIVARPDDQTLYRDLAEVLIATGRRPEAIELIEKMPPAGLWRAGITIMLAQAYVDEKRYGDCIDLLESTPYFVNWEGQDITWRLFNQAHVARGRERMDKKDYHGALADFEAALTYPKNLNVGRSNKPQEAPAQYWRGKALAALGRPDEARAAYQLGAQGADVPGQQNDYRQKCRHEL